MVPENGKGLKLRHSLYGMQQSPKNFFKHLKTRLGDSEFVQSKFDTCLFVGKLGIWFMHIDDCLFFSPNEDDIQRAINKLKEQTFNLNAKDVVVKFLLV